MAQKRMLHKRLLESEKIQSLRGNDRARFLYTALLPYTDKAGRLNVNPMGLKGTILEPFEYTVDDIQEAFADLAEVGLIVLYRTPKHALLAEYQRFTEFNRPHPNEAASDLPGPDDPGSEHVTLPGNPSGNIRKAELPGREPTETRSASPFPPPESFPEESRGRSIEGPSPTPTLTPSPTQSREEVSHDDELEDCPEARFTRLATTGRSEHAETSRARAVIRRLAGPKFAAEHEPYMPAWSRHSTARIEELWSASDPNLWPAERSKRRTWLFTDLLNEERYPPNENREPEREYEDIDGGDLLGIGTISGTWGPS